MLSKQFFNQFKRPLGVLCVLASILTVDPKQKVICILLMLTGLLLVPYTAKKIQERLPFKLEYKIVFLIFAVIGIWNALFQIVIDGGSSTAEAKTIASNQSGASSQDQYNVTKFDVTEEAEPDGKVKLTLNSDVPDGLPLKIYATREYSAMDNGTHKRTEYGTEYFNVKVTTDELKNGKLFKLDNEEWKRQFKDSQYRASLVSRTILPDTISKDIKFTVILSLNSADDILGKGNQKLTGPAVTIFKLGGHVMGNVLSSVTMLPMPLNWTPPPSQAPPVEYDTPASQDYSVQAETAVKALLKDPNSAMFADERTRNVVVCGSVNSKNSFGGYVGKTAFMYNALNNKAVIRIDMNQFGSVPERDTMGGGNRPQTWPDVVARLNFDHAWTKLCGTKAGNF